MPPSQRPRVEFRGSYTLYVNGESVDRIFGSIEELRYVDELALITFDHDPDSEHWNRNLIAVDHEGIHWRIEACPETREGTSDRYVGTRLDDDVMWAIPRWGKREYRIDLETGEIVESRKR